MKGERLTVYFFISVGSGIGPIIFASWRSAVSMICFTDASRILFSYALTRMRSFTSAPASFDDVPLTAFAFATFEVVFAFVAIHFNEQFYSIPRLVYAMILVTTPAPTV